MKYSIVSRQYLCRKTLDWNREFLRFYRMPIPPEDNGFTKPMGRTRFHIMESELEEIKTATTEVNHLHEALDFLYVVCGSCIQSAVTVPMDFPRVGPNYGVSIRQLQGALDLWEKQYLGEECCYVKRQNTSRLLLLDALDYVAVTAGMLEWDEQRVLRAMEAIQKANMSKTWTETEAQNVDGKLKMVASDGKWIVRNEHGKVIKPPSFVAVDISKV